MYLILGILLYLNLSIKNTSKTSLTVANLCIEIGTQMLQNTKKVFHKIDGHVRRFFFQKPIVFFICRFIFAEIAARQKKYYNTSHFVKY
jgi:hypothetical protein